MARAAFPSQVQVEAQPDVYTVLIGVACLVLVATLGVLLYYLLSAPPSGCGLSFGDLLSKVVPPGAGK
ncbi:MAG: hypothetical protein MUP47_09890 [Phycisphaerae bacterium]|nr:hypothetical protein [Phycisphaerae bacterium]